ncbi:3-hxdroxyacyl-CoA dehydrogenase [Persicimonas caeni]|uniref:3-hxdroxyacyl-CoA dehydrogenase n=1 Tax=Persicimonas caeni TaxID=2292766 RepID=A0A4Y6PXT6_PERCE|nr:enoyl-CoA hydratase-related protein [Persicimonas caeni]QDG53136.1 3-hxdroxyacyl-CoA dehydrogenase [Persicimonas caeni]QED34358.1 3-hxdroxyacyl-CoA dehydrogenase [Persicimonas caeni]
MSDVLYEVENAVATITLNRPDARNAYSTEMAKELVEALDRAELDDEVRAVIVTGAGPAFCAGGDLKAMREESGMFAGDPVELRDNYLRGMQTIPRRFERFEKPVVAAINGHAIGAGLDLSLMCDIRIASDAAKFGSTFARVGLIPGDGGAYLLTRIVGFSKAVELILTAKVIGADEALELGLVSEVVPRDDVMDRARATAEQIASLPPKAVKTAKAALYRCVDRDIETALQITAALQACVQRTDEHQEAVEAMLEKISKS